MVKIFPILLALIIVSGCAGATKTVTSAVTAPITAVDKTANATRTAATKVLSPATGYLLFITVLELRTNVSSLFIDKTKENVTLYNSAMTKKLIPGQFLYFMPPRITHSDGTYTFDTEMNRLIRNYMTIGQYGIPVEDVRQADYIVVINIKESFNRNYGTNTSEVAFSIMDKMDYPVYASTVRMESTSDKNFWYYPEKPAMSVDQLTMKALSYIMANSLPEANGDQKAMQSSIESYLAKFSKEKEK